jgi:hypothetical protein
MNIELGNVKYAAFASEETNCFEANILIDGVKVGSVRNDGKGGAHFFHPFALQRQLDEYGKTLPVARSFPLAGTGAAIEFQPDAESIVNDLLTDWLIARDVRRALTKRILFTKAGRKGLFQTKAMPAAEVVKAITNPQVLNRLQADKVLNLLPFVEAVALFKAEARVS